MFISKGDQDMWEKVQDIIHEARLYFEVRKDLVKLRTAESASQAAGNAIAFAVIGILGLITLVLFSVTLAIGIGWALGNSFWGFLIVTALYVVAGAVLWIKREAIFRVPVLKTMQEKMFTKNDKADGRVEGNKAA